MLSRSTSGTEMNIPAPLKATSWLVIIPSHDSVNILIY